MRKIYGLLCASAFGLVGYAQPVLTEGFEAGVPPADWISFDNGVGTVQSWQSSSTAHGGNAAAFINYENAGAVTEDWLVTSQINLTGVTNAELRFYTRQLFSSDYLSEYRVLVSTASQSTTTDFTLVQSWTEITLNNTYDQYEEKVVNLSAYDGQQIYVAFVFVQNDADAWYIDDVTVGPPPACPVVTNPTAVVSYDGATISWTAGGSETNWNLEYGQNGFNQGAGVTMGVSGTPSQIISNLDATTTYQYYIQANCGAGDLSTWVGPFSFTTTCAPVEISSFPWTENFDGVTEPQMPCGWYVDNLNNDSQTWKTSGNSPASGANSMYIEYNFTETMNDWAYTPALDLQAGTSYRLTFKKKVESENYPENLTIAIGSGQAPAFMTTSLLDLNGMINTDYETVHVDFTVPGTDTYYIGFHGHSDANQYYIYVDDITLDYSPSCVEPSALQLNSATDVTAQISWVSEGSATAWDIEYGPAGFVQGSGVPASVNDTVVELEGLNSLTAYDFYVRSNCGGDSSVWTGPFTFETTCPHVVISTLPWNEGFETAETPELPCGWTSENLNNDNKVWESTTSYSSTGDQGMVINYNGIMEMNDWAYTPEIILQAGVNYVLSFKYRTSSSYPENLEVKIGDQNASTAMTIQLIDLDSIETATFTSAVVPFTVAADGSYFIGFHGYSDADMYYIAIDDIVLDRACSAAFEVNPDTICTQSLPVVPQINGSLGGTFSGSNGLVVDASTGAITPVASTLGAHTLTYVVSNQVCSDTTTVDLVIENCAGLEESVLNLVQVYPNPSNGILHVEVPVADGSVALAVTNLSGQKVTETVIANQQVTELNLNALQNGVYLITFTMNNQIVTRRVVLNK